MADIEKVIKGLECCAARNGTCQYKQEPICPYVERCQKEDYAALQRDALALLKEQEAVEPITEHYFFLCPVCKNKLFRDKKFCCECGKRIKWEGW